MQPIIPRHFPCSLKDSLSKTTIDFAHLSVRCLPSYVQVNFQAWKIRYSIYKIWLKWSMYINHLSDGVWNKSSECHGLRSRGDSPNACEEPWKPWNHSGHQPFQSFTHRNAFLPHAPLSFVLLDVSHLTSEFLLEQTRIDFSLALSCRSSSVLHLAAEQLVYTCAPWRAPSMSSRSEQL